MGLRGSTYYSTAECIHCIGPSSPIVAYPPDPTNTRVWHNSRPLASVRMHAVSLDLDEEDEQEHEQKEALAGEVNDQELSAELPQHSEGPGVGVGGCSMSTEDGAMHGALLPAKPPLLDLSAVRPRGVASSAGAGAASCGTHSLPRMKTGVVLRLYW